MLAAKNNHTLIEVSGIVMISMFACQLKSFCARVKHKLAGITAVFCHKKGGRGQRAEGIRKNTAVPLPIP